MPDIDVIKLKIRRGTNAQRQLVVLDQGELGYTTDTQRVFVGDSATAGGIVVGSKNFIPVTLKTALSGAVIGDIVMENSVVYQLTASPPSATASWARISPKFDGLTIVSNSTGTISISADNLIDNNTLTTVNNRIRTQHLYLSAAKSSTVQPGLSVSASGLGVYSDPTYFEYSGNQMTLNEINVLTSAKVTLSADENYFDTTSGALRFAPIQLPTNDITLDSGFMTINAHLSGFYSAWTSNLSVNSSAPYFGGNINIGASPQTSTYKLTAYNMSTAAMVSLSSVGFITLSKTVSGDGFVQRLAIPIFAY